MDRIYGSRTAGKLLRRMCEQFCALKLDGEELPRAELLALQAEADSILKGQSNRGRGNPNLSEARGRAIERRREMAEARRLEIQPIIAELRAEGLISYAQIAAALDARGIKPPTSEKWAPNSVRMLERQVAPKDPT